MDLVKGGNSHAVGRAESLPVRFLPHYRSVDLTACDFDLFQLALLYWENEVALGLPDNVVKLEMWEIIPERLGNNMALWLQ